jgi:hypothetical protein
MDATSLNSLIDPADPVWTFVFGGAVVIGLLLWLMGRKIARQTIAVSGLLIGGLVAFPFSQQFGADARLTLAWVIGGAVAGCLIAWLLFRVWMGVSMAAILALALPTAILMVQGAPTPWSPPQDANADAEHVAAAAPAPAHAPPDADDKKTGDDDANADAPKSPTLRTADKLHVNLTPQQREQIEKTEAHLFDTVQAVYDQQRDQTVTWWQNVGGANQKKIIGSCAAGALIGLLLGLGFPTFSAAVQSALVGSLLLVGGAQGFLAAYARPKEGSILISVQANLIAVGLITALGFLLQWIIWRKKADQ